MPRPRPTLEELLLAAANGGSGKPTAPTRMDEFAPFLGEQPGGTFMGDAPPPRKFPATVPAPPPVAMPTGQPTVTEPPIPDAQLSLYSGERTAGMNDLGKLMLRKRLLADPRNLNREVYDTAEGIEVAPEKGPPSRKKQALIGLLQGLTMAGQQSGGDPWATLAGGATGAAAGGISPKLVKALTRDQEVQRVQGQISTEQKNAMGQSQIAENEAQARQHAAQPELESLRILQQHQRDQAAAADRTTRSEQAAEANKIRAKTLDETIRKNKADEKKIGGPDERVVGNQIFRRDEKDSVWRVAPGSPAPTPTAAEDRRGEKSADRTAKGVQAGKLYEKGAEYWDQAQKKRDEAKTFSASATTRVTNKDTITRLLREAESLETKTRDVQIKGDELAAESESEPAAPTASTGAFNFTAWKAKYPNATPEQIEAVRARHKGKKFL